MKLKYLILFFLTLYISFGGIYWLPGINTSALLILKYTIISLSVFIFIFTQKILTPPKWKILLILLFISTLIFSLREINFISLQYLISFTFGIIVLLIGYTFTKYDVHTLDLLRKVFYATSFFSIIIILSLLNILPNFHNPISVSVFKSGFNFKSTGWSFWLCQITPIVFLFDMKKFNKKLLIIVFLLCILFVQFLSNGRAGFLASIISIFIFVCIKYFKRINIKSVFAFVLLSLIIIITLNYYSQDLSHFIYRERNESASVEDLTTYRALQWEILPSLISDKIFWGYGNLGIQQLFQSVGLPWEFHNTYIRVIIDYGIFLSIPILILFYRLAKIVFHTIFKLHNNNRTSLVISLMILNTLIVALVEANTLVGVFQNSSMTWFSIGIILAYYNKLKILL